MEALKANITREITEIDTVLNPIYEMKKPKNKNVTSDDNEKHVNDKAALSRMVISLVNRLVATQNLLTKCSSDLISDLFAADKVIQNAEKNMKTLHTKLLEATENLKSWKLLKPMTLQWLLTGLMMKYIP